MTSKYKAPTDNTPPLSSVENTEALAQPSAQSASSDNTPPSTKSTPKSSAVTRKDAERVRQHADMARVTIRLLEKRGLIRRYKVLSQDGTTVKAIRIEFSPSFWTDDLHLKLLSDGLTTVWEETATT